MIEGKGSFNRWNHNNFRSTILVKWSATVLCARVLCKTRTYQRRISMLCISLSSICLLSAAPPTRIISINKALSHSKSNFWNPLSHAKAKPIKYCPCFHLKYCTFSNYHWETTLPHLISVSNNASNRGTSPWREHNTISINFNITLSGRNQFQPIARGWE